MYTTLEQNTLNKMVEKLNGNSKLISHLEQILNSDLKKFDSKKITKRIENYLNEFLNKKIIKIDNEYNCIYIYKLKENNEVNYNDYHRLNLEGQDFNYELIKDKIMLLMSDLLLKNNDLEISINNYENDIKKCNEFIEQFKIFKDSISKESFEILKKNINSVH